LVSFNKPIALTSKSDLRGDDQDSIRNLTKKMEERIRSGTLDAPSWEIMRAAHTARRLFAPYGTTLALGPTIRLTQRFVDILTARAIVDPSTDSERSIVSPIHKPPTAFNLQELTTSLKVMFDAHCCSISKFILALSRSFE
jgi:hypothetical protein